MFDLGDLVPLSIQIRNAAGQPEDATSVSVTITLPDGTSETHGPIPSSGAGAYDYDYPTMQAGWHGVRWLATGLNASAFTDSFDVAPAAGAAFISVGDARQHLRKDVDDEQLRWYVATACQMITDRMGVVSPTVVVAERRAHRGTVVLPTRPVIAITSVQRLPGLEVVPADDAATSARGWTLESPEGLLSVSGSSLVRVTYLAGRNPLPPNFRMAALELVAHLWRGSQHNQAGGRPPLGDGDALSASVRPFAMPYRVLELLGLKKDQERDEPLVG
ncbi:hypothetical protein OG589_14525 [Sphaerisporangium sp. NBC_01403]|uniref:hypothetical protein n=1 Tax=Sphaerisporangium sp. NBC_01403 TaxID=2903599 RepID=UPI0032545AAF